MTLYEIERDLLELLERGFNDACIDKETGEIDEALAAKYLEELPVARERKLEAYGLVIKNYLAEIEALKKEEERLAERRKSKERQVERLKTAITNSMLAFEDTKFETAKVVFTFRKSTAIEIPDASKLAKLYLRRRVEYTPDKTAIKQALIEGKKVKGASLVTKQNLQVK